MSPRHLIVFSLALAVAVTVSAQSSSSSKPSRSQKSKPATRYIGTSEEDFKKAVQAVQSSDFATAEPLLKKAADDDPKNYQAWFYLGYLYSATNRQDDAVAAYRKAVALQPGVFESNLNLGMLLASQAQSESAKYLRIAGQLKPNAEQQSALSHAWLLLASKLEPSDFAGSVDAYQQAAGLSPKDPAPLLAQGQLLQKHNDLSAAEKAYKEALARDPKSADVLAVLSNFYLSSKRYPDAERSLREYLRTNPQNPNAHLQLGRVLRAQGKNDEAAAELEKALELHPGDLDALKELGAAQYAAKKYPAAEATVRNILARQPDDPDIQYMLGSILMRQFKYADAQSAFLQTVKLKPDWGDAYGELAVAASGNKNYPLAIRALDARGKLLPETPGTYFLRATCYDHLQAYQEATENYKHFLAVADGKFPDQEWQARHRLIAIEPEKDKKRK
jgi:tetratricopeptide (TPR) repeat protein